MKEGLVMTRVSLTAAGAKDQSAYPTNAHRKWARGTQGACATATKYCWDDKFDAGLLGRLPARLLSGMRCLQMAVLSRLMVMMVVVVVASTSIMSMMSNT